MVSPTPNPLNGETGSTYQAYGRAQWPAAATRRTTRPCPNQNHHAQHYARVCIVCSMTYSAAVLGASGYGGAELLKLLSNHPEIDVVVVGAGSNAGARVGDLFPALAPVYGDHVYVQSNAAAAQGVDICFLALPHGASQTMVPDLMGKVGHIIDFGADFRLPQASYEQWYGDMHTAPQYIDEFGYGMTELYRDTITTKDHVAVPGCYPTAASYALAPLVQHGHIDTQGIVVNAMSGASGAGRALKITSHFSEVNENVSAYGLLHHRHTAEIEQALTHVGGTPTTVLFTPHLVPMTRGILATCTARPIPNNAGLSTAVLLAQYREFYSGEPFVHVTDEPSGTRATYGSNSVHVTVRYDERTNTVLAIAALDNMVKGAAGQALQNANLVCGLPETMSLPVLGVAP